MSSLVEFVEIKADVPSLKDNTADIDRLRRAITENRPGVAPVVSFKRLAGIARKFRQADFCGTAVVNNFGDRFEVVDFIRENLVGPVGMALDLGTTHLEASLLDLTTGTRLAEANLENPQIQSGADILTRIHCAMVDDGLEDLHRQVIKAVNELAGILAEKAGLAVAEIRALSVSGNTTMAHFFLKLDPYHLIREPYIPVANIFPPCQAGELGLAIDPLGPVWTMPCVGSYFGGDLISGVLVSGIGRTEQTSMLIDVGTNAEVVVGNSEWLIACAGAAGPALEGGVAKMGMRAGPGAVEHVDVDQEKEEFTYKTIGGGKPRGICGSGIIDLVAALYLTRMIDIRGRFQPDRKPELFVDTDQGLAFVIADGSDSADGRPVVFGQVDLDSVVRSKAAMFSILTTLIKQVGVSFAELERIYVAGAFGRHIAPRQAITLGMLPDLPLTVFESIGNSSLAGAELILLDGKARSESLELARKITYLELNVNQEFMNRFSGAKFIPHTDHSLFPSVPFFNAP
jgi:uncharacterized 2Fe-2S/4Fe-4S cluster protein (DUF4445 family)